MKIKLNPVYWNSEFEIETLKNKGIITIKSTESRSAGLGSHYDVTITTDKESYYIGDIGEVSSRTNLGEFFLSQMMEQNINVTLNRITHLHYEISFKKTSEKLEKLLKTLKELPSTRSGLRFNNFKSISDTKIVVEYNGHEVGGSYTYDYEVTPGYIDKLQVESNRKVTWNGRRSGRIGSDIYEFTIFRKKIISKTQESEVIKGKKYHIDSTSSGSKQSNYAFRTCPGLTWALMYSISEKLNKAEVANVDYKDKVVSFGGDEIFKVIAPAWEEDDSRPNSGRTHFRGTFDLYISEREFEKKYLELFGLKNDCVASIVYPSCTSPYIKMEMNDGTEDSRKIGYL